MTIQSLIEKAAPAILSAAVIAGGTAAFQFAQMRVELEVLKAGQVRLEGKVDALITRYHGVAELREVERLARLAGITQGPTPGVASAEEVR